MIFKESFLIETQSDNKNTFAVANYILELEKKGITNLKLQKLIFLAYGIHLSLYQEKLYSSQIQAWKLGPVVKDIYNEFKTHGRAEITTRANILISDNEFYSPTIPNDYEKEKMSVIAACLFYGKKSAYELVDITHEMNCWKIAYEKTKLTLDRSSKADDNASPILDDDIYEDFNKIKSEIVEFVNSY
jgi:uncharacterized phage-associated protein